jgi:cytochrome c-type biogenesis protein CcmE
MDEEFAEPDIYWLYQQVMANGHAEMFTNSKVIPKSLENYKSQNIEDVLFLTFILTHLEKFE